MPTNFATELRVLYVEDDLVTREITNALLSSRFSHVHLCANAEDALKIFENAPIDLILTDNFLPGMNGIEFIKHLRKLNWDIPIILITGYADTALLLEAINLGVTQFIPKPVNPHILENALEVSIQRVVLENLKRKNQEQELELLQYREKYYSSQQEAAFKKELFILRNDYFECVTDVDNRRWFVDTVYKGRDTLSGDTYSVRKLNSNELFCFVLDAMGKGIGASVTSMVATTYLNHLVDISKEGLDFEGYVSLFIRYIKPLLLNDEILCAAFLLVDFKRELMTYALFSMPRILIRRLNGEVSHIISNNIPILKSMKNFKIDKLPLNDIAKIMVSSDGLCEAERDDKVYSEYLATDFKTAGVLSSFIKLFKYRGFELRDDMTVFFLRRSSISPEWEESMSAESTHEGVKTLEEFYRQTVAKIPISESEGVKLSVAFGEAVMNAFEHGNLGIDILEKHNAIIADTYDQLLKERSLEYSHKRIQCYIAYIKEDSPLIRIRVIDEGLGINSDIHAIYLTGRYEGLYSGRGIDIIRKYTDQLYFSPDGGEIIMVKSLINQFTI